MTFKLVNHGKTWKDVVHTKVDFRVELFPNKSFCLSVWQSAREYHKWNTFVLCIISVIFRRVPFVVKSKIMFHLLHYLTGRQIGRQNYHFEKPLVKYIASNIINPFYELYSINYYQTCAKLAHNLCVDVKQGWGNLLLMATHWTDPTQTLSLHCSCMLWNCTFTVWEMAHLLALVDQIMDFDLSRT